MSSTPASVLRDVFGLPGFRPGQIEVVEAQLSGRDVLSVAPTGSGKSISYWVPAIAGGGLTIVVSPLIALMKDQVDRLVGHGVAATYVNSTLERQEQQERIRQAIAGDLRLLYLAPERFSRPGFLDLLGRMKVRRLVVDEAHCISSWGHDFRPDYRILGRAIEACGRPAIGAFTATATPRVRDDIARSLGMREPLVKVTGFNRPNLLLAVERCRGERGKLEALRARLDPGSGRALVYTGTVAAAEEVAAAIGSWGLAAGHYHGRLGDEERRRVQEDFAAGRLRVVVATSAFGMGIDIPDIRQVVHHHLPGSLEQYYQEAGRAGRDGLPASCLLLFSPADRDLQSFFIEQAHPEGDSELKRNAYARLAQVMSYAQLRACRHARIADYFGEEGTPRTCAACDSCLDGGRLPDVVVEPESVRAALAAVGRLSGRVGAVNVAAVLAGKENRWVRGQPWVLGLPVYGRLRGWREERLRELLSGLMEAGCVAQSSGEYPVLQLTARGREVLTGSREVEVRLAADRVPPGPRPEAAAAAYAPGGPACLEALRRWRAVTARRAGVPAYVVFHDSALAAIAARRPASRAELLAVPGVGPAKLERYGEDVLRVVASCSGA